MRLLIKTIISFSVVLLFFIQSPMRAEVNSGPIFGSDTCAPIVDNYLDAIGEFNSILEVMVPLSIDKHVTDALEDAEKGIKDNNITYNAMQAYEGAIQAELKKHPNSALNEGMSQLISQMGSLHTRVDQWKNSGCREKHACDLGQPGYCSKKQ